MSNARNITPDTSPELEERPRSRDLHEHDARRIIEMRRNMTSTRRMSPKPEAESPLTSPVTRSMSPMRRPNCARDQAQRARLDDEDEEEKRRLIEAVRDKNAGRRTEDTEQLQSTEIIFTDGELYRDIL